MSKGIKGIITPTITPIKRGKVDDKAVGRLMSFLSVSGVDGIFPTGSTGAFPFLNVDTHIAIMRAFYEHLPEKMQFLPGTGRNSIAETVEVSKVALKLDADAVVVATPYYMHLDQRALFDYFSRVAVSIGGDMVLYNIPQLSGNAIGSQTVKSLVKKHRNIIGVKESSGHLKNFAGIAGAVLGSVDVLQGQDNLLLPSLLLGASGGVCGTTNFTGLAVNVYKAFKAKRIKEAEALQNRLTDVMSSANLLPFPSNYNYLFYRTVMRKRATNAAEPLRDIANGEGNIAFAKVRKIMAGKP